MGEARHLFQPGLIGALLGAGAADVLLGLNPDLLAPRPTVLLLSGAALAGLLAGAFLALLLRTRQGAPSSLPYLLVGVLLLLSAFAEHQRLLYRLFLPGGSRRLLGAVSLFALAGAAAILVWSLRGRKERSSTPLLLLLLGLFLVVPILGRRRPEPTPLATPPPVARGATRALLVVGLEGVSWELISRQASDGALPVLSRLLAEGAGGPLASLEPHDAAALWMSAATGKVPSRHGVVSSIVHRTLFGDLRLLPRLFDFPAPERFPLAETVRLDDPGRRSLTFWEILARRGHEAAVLNWSGARPARPGLVLWATEELFSGGSGPGLGHPPALSARAQLLAVSPDHLDQPLAKALLPNRGV